uniref:Uncharacterized protein n=1 Tax=Tanacetum cinerariifolium TaxID=118510 RepID=A0A6L2K8W4_TANCI|nr:hypothetical protein [Tanacetum cinerariifolium]
MASPSPEYIPGLEYPEYLAPSDDEIPVEDHPLTADALPTALTSSYGNDDKEEESSEDDDDEEEEEEEASEEDEHEEDEHLALADSTLPTIDPVPSVEETEPFETDESAAQPPPPISPRTIVTLSMTRLRRTHMTVNVLAWKVKSD